MKKHHMAEAHGQYENEVEKPKVAPHGHQEAGMGCHEFKDQASPIAYGQAGKSGCESDNKKIMGQMKHYHWEAADNY